MRRKLKVGQKVVVIRERVRRVIDRMDGSGGVRLTKPIAGFHWWHIEDLRPLTKRERSGGRQTRATPKFDDIIPRGIRIRQLCRAIDSTALVFHQSGSVVFWPPRECRCGRMASFFKNHNGATVCLECVRREP